jgi:Ca2+-dependent lipid-binding protein
MKDLNDQELLDLAYNEIRKMDIHIISTVIFVITLVVEFILTFLQIIVLPVFFIFLFAVIILYYYHNQRFKKCEKRIDEILKELTSREL